MATAKKTSKPKAKKPAVKKTAKKTTKRGTSSALAVIQSGGKQYIIGVGETLKVEKLKGIKKDGSVVFDNILLIIDGKAIKMGNPFIKGAKVSAKVEEEGKAKKITVLKYKRKTRYRVKKGHRQPYSKIKITEIK